MKYKKLKKDDRVGFWHNFLYEFGLVFLIVFANSYGLIFIYNKLVGSGFSIGLISFFIIMFLITGSVVCALLVYFTRARIYSRTLQNICKAAQSVAKAISQSGLMFLKKKRQKPSLIFLKRILIKWLYTFLP